VTPDTGRVRVRRAASPIDSGEVVHPEGIRNQTEGGILQALSWTLLEAVRAELAADLGKGGVSGRTCRRPDPAGGAVAGMIGRRARRAGPPLTSARPGDPHRRYAVAIAHYSTIRTEQEVARGDAPCPARPRPPARRP
jgi:hypothetical protein